MVRQRVVMGIIRIFASYALYPSFSYSKDHSVCTKIIWDEAGVERFLCEYGPSEFIILPSAPTVARRDAGKAEVTEGGCERPGQCI